jgi:pimeloyl-ACP methyl ester carboxylesterase
MPDVFYFSRAAVRQASFAALRIRCYRLALISILGSHIMKKIEPIRFKETDYTVEGLFVKEVSMIEPASLQTPILMVHGACHGWWVYHKWLPFFAAAGWRVYAMSLRNHAGSYTVPDEAYRQLTVEDYSQDVLNVLGWLARPAILIGHSMGGITVQKAAELASLRALILLASVGPGQLGAIRDPLPADENFMFTPEQARQIWFHRIGDEAFNQIYQQLVPESVGVMNHYSSGDLKIDRSKILCPVLAVGAEHDRTLVHSFESLADFYQCDRLFVPDAGHDFMLEPAAIDVALRINHWLLSVLPDEGLPLSRRTA